MAEKQQSNQESTRPYAALFLMQKAIYYFFYSLTLAKQLQIKLLQIKQSTKESTKVLTSTEKI